MSKPASTMLTGSKALPETEMAVAVGASFTGVTVRETVAGAEESDPSKAR